MAAFTALALGLLGAAVASQFIGGGDTPDRSGGRPGGRSAPVAPAPTDLGTVTPPSTNANDSAAIPQAQTAANRAAKRAAAGDTILTGGQAKDGTAATPKVQPLTLLGK